MAMTNSKIPQHIVIPQAAYCSQSSQPVSTVMRLGAHNLFNRSPNSFSAFQSKVMSPAQSEPFAAKPFVNMPPAAPFMQTSASYTMSVNGQPELQHHAMSYVVRVGSRGKTMHMCAFNGCQKSFSKPSALKRHIRTHTGERPFVCSEANCHRRFAERGNLKRHMRVHTGERPFACHHDGCLRKFARMRHLMAHIRSQHSDSPVSPTSQIDAQKLAHSSIVDESSSVSSGGNSFRKKNPLNSCVDMSIDEPQLIQKKVSSAFEDASMSEKSQNPSL